MFIIAGLSAVAAMASAFSIDPQIVIDRALDSPTLTVRYTGVTAALVELRVNGESLGTRSVSASKSTGETNFTLSLSDLKDGDNDVEVRLFDRTGKLVAHDHTKISTEPVQKGPVILTTPKMGATVLGPVEIKVDFSKELRNAYVSFFIDGNFKSMTNFPPYTYLWDSERATNGWHEIEAWAIDDSSTTHKTRKVRVFVNNPGGRTDRPGTSSDIVPTRNVNDYNLSGANGPKAIALKAKGAAVAKPMGLPPALRDELVTKNPFAPALGAEAGAKAVSVGKGVPTGQQHLLPTGKRVAQNAGSVLVKNPGRPVIVVSDHQPGGLGTQGQVFSSVASAANLIPISKGSRFTNLGTFSVVYNNSFVDFDVAPRVDEGIPMTPVRYLLEKAGGKVDWANVKKEVTATADGNAIFLRIGDRIALVNRLDITLEKAPYIDHGRTIVPLSFIRDALKVDVEYDKETGHVLITSIKK